MKTKYYLIFLALLLSCSLDNKAFAQKCLAFKYDADGNRISRIIKSGCLDIRDYEEDQEPEASKEEVVVYPNPNNGSFKVVMPESIRQDNSFFELFDVNGLPVCEGNIIDIETDIDIGNYPPGVYLLKIRNGDDVISEIVLKQ